MLVTTIRHLMEIYPPEYRTVSDEFSSIPGINEAIKAGLKAAVDKEIRKAEAYYALSDVFEKEDTFGLALDYYEQAMALEEGSRRHSHSYLKFAGLCLKSGKREKAYAALADSLKNSEKPLKTIHSICKLFHSLSRYELFIEFAGTIEKKQMYAPDLEICLAQTRLEMDQPDKARQILNDLNERLPSHEAFYMLAVMAQKKKDWDAMELASQRATVLAPHNRRYLSLFLKALCAQRKYESAEYQAGRAIERAAQPSAYLYDTRARLRYRIKDLKGAASDWEKALTLDPENKTYQNMLKKLNPS